MHILSEVVITWICNLNRTLLQWLRDDSLPKKVLPFLPFLISLSDEEVHAYLQAAPREIQGALTTKGLARLLPQSAQAWILGHEETATMDASVDDASSSTSGAIIRSSRPNTEVPPWAVRVLSMFMRRRLLRGAEHVLDACGVPGEGASLDVALAVTVLWAVQAALAPRGWVKSTAIFNSATMLVWGVYVARKSVRGALHALQPVTMQGDTLARLGPQPAEVTQGELEHVEIPRLPVIAPSVKVTVANLVRYAQALQAYYKDRARRAPLRVVSSVMIAVLLVVVTLLRTRRSALRN